MRINNNIAALNTLRQYSANTNSTNKAMEKLSSGLAINRAGDDAAGLAISEKMRAQIRGIDMAADNSQNAISLVQTAEGALTETHSILQRMNELAVQGASDTNEGIDRDALDAEFQQLKTEIDDIANQTKFNNKKLLDGSVSSQVDTDTAVSSVFTVAGINGASAGGATGTNYAFADTGDAAAAGTLTIIRTDGVTGATETVNMTSPVLNTDGTGTISVSNWGLNIDLGPGYVRGSIDGTDLEMKLSGGLSIQTGATNGEKLTIDIDSMKSSDLGLTSSAVDSQKNAEDAITAITSAINEVSTQRANLGAYQNRLEHKINNLSTSAENLQSAESNIRDVDMAEEMVNYTKNNILLQAAQSMLAQANAQPQGVLQLLQ